MLESICQTSIVAQPGSWRGQNSPAPSVPSSVTSAFQKRKKPQHEILVKPVLSQIEARQVAAPWLQLIFYLSPTKITSAPEAT